ncbi:unnamed protein product, partial [Timema podura]|nr:unnamed protein product [Timema podura]
LLLAVVVHRRKTDDMFKDTDDIRENIINYEDEGGGEGDMTGYDLNVLRLMYDQDGLPIVDKPPLKESYHTRSGVICGQQMYMPGDLLSMTYQLQKQSTTKYVVLNLEKEIPFLRDRDSPPEEVPDICGFLDAKKKVCDNDPETYPFDDVRHYAYEGDGNSTGSLSSLASGTDENDLNFDDLSNFGPRFRKLADMYGEDPSDEEEEENFHNAASESCPHKSPLVLRTTQRRSALCKHWTLRLSLGYSNPLAVNAIPLIWFSRILYLLLSLKKVNPYCYMRVPSKKAPRCPTISPMDDIPSDRVKGEELVFCGRDCCVSSFGQSEGRRTSVLW